MSSFYTGRLGAGWGPVLGQWGEVWPLTGLAECFSALPPLSVRSLALSPSNQATPFLIVLSEKNLKFSETIQHNTEPELAQFFRNYCFQHPGMPHNGPGDFTDESAGFTPPRNINSLQTDSFTFR